MKITIVGRGNIGGGLARLWAPAGHDVTTPGREGGDAADTDVLVVAVPGEVVPAALGRVSGTAGKPAIDAADVLGPRDERYDSNAHLVKPITRGPAAKTFNVNFASEFSKVVSQPAPPGNLPAAGPGIRELARQLNRDPGYDPVYAEDLTN